MSVKEKLLRIQAELKAPKGNYNSFGKYKYRSCEDILEAVKPLLEKNKATMVISDEIVEVGGRVYVKATACVSDIESDSDISNTAYARESLDKKGQDDSQITGTASSYARKYALNGLLLIDDTKDADTNEYQEESKQDGFAKPNKTYKQGETPVEKYSTEDALKWQKASTNMRKAGIDPLDVKTKVYIMEKAKVIGVDITDMRNGEDIENFAQVADFLIKAKEEKR